MYFRQPRYFNDFHCVGGNCDNNCCFGWRIDWNKEEVDKVKNAPDISPELKELVEKSFIPNVELKGKYQIEFDERGKCPFLTEDGWCRIQRELGAEYLSYVCTVYPRNFRVAGSTIYASCHLSCPEVTRRILNDSRAIDLVNLVTESHVKAIGYSEETIISQPELKYQRDIFEFFFELISDKRYSVEDSLVLGALAAQSLTRLVEKKEFDRIPEALKSFRQQFHNPEQLKNIAGIKPNYYAKLGLLGQMMKELCLTSNNPADNTIALTDESGAFNIDLYISGENALKKALEDRSFAMRNIALNLLLELNVPFKKKDFSIFKNYAIYVAVFALFKLNAIAAAEIKERADEQLRKIYDLDEYMVKYFAMLSRTLIQSEDVYDMINTILHNNKIISPAYLALLIK